MSDPIDMIRRELASLEAQERHMQEQRERCIATLSEINGAQRLCRHLLGKLERERATENTNGSNGEVATAAVECSA